MEKNKINTSLYFMISSSCNLTKGYNRTLVQDFLRSYADYIPNEYYELSLLLDRHKISDVSQLVDDSSKDEFYDFIRFMLEREYAFLTDDIKLFPHISMEFHDHNILTDAILEIEYNKTPKSIVKRFLEELNNLGCACLQVRLYSFSCYSVLSQIFDFVCNYNFKYIEIHVDNSSIISYDECCHILSTHAQITNIFLYNALEYEAKDYYEIGNNGIDAQLGSVIYISNKLDNSNCGIVNKFCQVYKDRRFYIMSKNFNSCLYKKVSLDINGYVKNCPSAPEKYDIKNGLFSIIQSSEFQKYWTIKKDDVEICKDCEYRYNCLDCRFHTEKGGLYSKPITCKYNPYCV